MSDRDTSTPGGLYNEEDIKGREDASTDLPEDMRDRIGSTSESLRQPVASDDATLASDRDWDEQDASALPDAARARNPVTGGFREPTRDLSLSRDVDLEAAGGDVEARRGTSDAPGL